jgi:hypothetical protein
MLMECCGKFMEIIDFKVGQYKCKCKICNDVMYYEPYGGE